MHKIKGVKYISPCLDNSGYAKAARGNIRALTNRGIDVTVKPISFENSKPDIGDDSTMLSNIIGKDIDYNIVITHTTPEFWEGNYEDDKININYTIWETTTLPKSWPDMINKWSDKVLVGCAWNKEVFIDSGVSVPVGVVPHAVSTNDSVVPYDIDGISENTFVFYNISQFVERKGLLSVIKAYWAAFQNGEDVALILKTYRSDYSEAEKEAIRMTIRRLKAVTVFDSYPEIYLISHMLSDEEIRALHERGDCYFSLSRGEGIGLSDLKAAACGKPVINVGFGGVTEFLKDYNSFLVDYSLTPVFGMPYNRWMTADQLFAEADVFDAIEKLKYVFNNREVAIKKGKLLKDLVVKNFSYDAIGERLIKEIDYML